MKRLLFLIVLVFSTQSIAFSQRGAWTTEEGDLTAMIMHDAKRDSIEWLDVHGVLGAEDIATIRSLPSLKKTKYQRLQNQRNTRLCILWNA